MAWWGVLGLPTSGGGLPIVNAAAAASKRGGTKKGGEPGGLMDWLNGALDKDHFSEMDPIMKKVEGGPPRPPPSKKPSPSSAKSNKQPPAAAGERGGSGLFGLFNKK